MSGGDSVTIRPVAPDDRAGWTRLWCDDLAFCRTAVTDDVADTPWARLMDAPAGMAALVAEQDRNIQGCATTSSTPPSGRSSRPATCKTFMLTPRDAAAAWRTG